MARMTCYKPGERSRLFYATREYRGRKNEQKGFGWKDYRDLVIRAVKRKLKMLQYRPEVIDGCLTGTGRTLSA